MAAGEEEANDCGVGCVPAGAEAGAAQSRVIQRAYQAEADEDDGNSLEADIRFKESAVVVCACAAWQPEEAHVCCMAELSLVSHGHSTKNSARYQNRQPKQTEEGCVNVACQCFHATLEEQMVAIDFAFCPARQIVACCFILALCHPHESC